MIATDFTDAIRVFQAAQDDQALQAGLRSAVDVLTTAFRNGKKVLSAGNGGSAADSQHFAAELVGRYKRERRGLPALSLTTDTSVLTAWSNDYAFETVFARQVEALGAPGDVLVVISTSGNSKNLLAATDAARGKKLTVIGLLGGSGGLLKSHVDLALVVPSNDTPRIQEVHTLIIHSLSDEIEQQLS